MSLFDSYQAHLVSHPTENEFFGLLGDSELDNIQLEKFKFNPMIINKLMVSEN